jgi:hypothetical protein
MTFNDRRRLKTKLAGFRLIVFSNRFCRESDFS